MDDLERFLDLVRRELGSDDARFELGGREPSGDDRVWASVPHSQAQGGAQGWRAVAVFDAAQTEEALAEHAAKLDGLVHSFVGIVDRLAHSGPRGRVSVASQEVDDALGVLAERAKALRAVVIDEDSPVLWGSSEVPRGPEDVEEAMWIGELAESAAQYSGPAGEDGLDLVALIDLDKAARREALAAVEPRKLRERLLRKLPVVRELGGQRDAEAWRTHFLTCRAIAAVRRAPERHEEVQDGLGWLARDFGGIYHVILVYDGLFSEIGAAGVMQRALPAIENLVLSLPPIDPTPKGARVLQFRPRG
ncbi:hypothetical protein G6O69_14975 [Pseudenhygromyxa sp. WMMC2535]|uniref:hypothetical protein n=1 Tax=Pseudenhygromyxa sp. WMMC2535 TaxID=2712867 RepID=UPI001552D858|nr:hypothetical protein [Pseudenhygromyxa sp. WMMC2535]NVB39145.1 hypothetical protein [Pseudenhygromyxa sp. WMMC2535]